MSADPKSERIRLDKWLWAARFFKTRALASEDIGHGRVAVNGQVAKASREVRLGELIELRQSGQSPREVFVRGLSAQRGPAPVAQLLYEETAASIARREAAALARRQGNEPAQTLEHGRPTKRNRRQLADWQRWSASVDDEPK
jgi:ribosome-associated heat shock protein Hsp15